MMIILSFKEAIHCRDKTSHFNYLTFSLQTFSCLSVQVSV